MKENNGKRLEIKVRENYNYWVKLAIIFPKERFSIFKDYMPHCFLFCSINMFLFYEMLTLGQLLNYFENFNSWEKKNLKDWPQGYLSSNKKSSFCQGFKKIIKLANSRLFSRATIICYLISLCIIFHVWFCITKYQTW